MPDLEDILRRDADDWRSAIDHELGQTPAEWSFGSGVVVPRRSPKRRWPVIGAVLPPRRWLSPLRSLSPFSPTGRTHTALEEPLGRSRSADRCFPCHDISAAPCAN